MTSEEWAVTRAKIFFALYASIFAFRFSPFILHAENVRGEEPSRWEQVFGFSDLWELDELGLGPGLWSGESVWRFRSDKPNAETFGTNTESSYIQPFYLYNRTSFNWVGRDDSSRQIQGSIIGIRRDETSTGAGEPPAMPENFGLLWRHGGVLARDRSRSLVMGDFILGWGQGLLAARHRGVSYRSWIDDSPEAKISLNRSYYENTGWRGLGFEWSKGGHKDIVALTQTPLNGEVSNDGKFLEDYAVIDDAGYGEYGDGPALAERHNLMERAVLWRREISWENSLFAADAAWVSFNRNIDPIDSANVQGFGQNDGYFFRGDRLALVSADGFRRVLGEDKIFWEGALSLWRNHEAWAWMAGFRRKEPFKLSVGVFHFSPYFVSRWADGVRLDGVGTRNREGLFFSSLADGKTHETGFDFFAERNLAPEFTGFSSSRGAPDSRWNFHLRADDRWLWSKDWSVYGRFELEADPYFVDAGDDPRVVRIGERKLRLQWERRGQRLSQLWGMDHARAWSLNDRGERSDGKLAYWRLKYHAGENRRFYGKIAYFDLGPALYGSRYLYMSTPELYWRESTLSSIVYQSLFASYAPRGWRFAAAFEERASEGIALWVKWGSTSLAREDLPSVPQNTGDRDDYATLLKWDFKTEVSYQW
ncbi:MAG: hypothetical protein HY547_05880 [Elusimicrobia bacterium]|nr:hypothetical protein [Elusimicrobiota bacterium]